MITKSLKDISLNITEQEYRDLKALNYSILSKYEKEGFESLQNLNKPIENPSIIFGSLIDSLLTDSSEEFKSKFIIKDIQVPSTKIKLIIDTLFDLYGDTFKTIYSIKDEYILDIINKYNYKSNCKEETLLKEIKNKGEDYYNNLKIIKSNKYKIITQEMYEQALQTISALKTNNYIKKFLENTNPFEDVEHLYQLKFTTIHNDIKYKCMIDKCIVDHKSKTILLIDFKTTSKKEYKFYESYINYNYQIQARLYTRILHNNIFKDEYFKNFIILPFINIVINKNSLLPLCWESPFYNKFGDLIYGKNKNIIFRDPYIIGEELNYCLENNLKFPFGIKDNEVNNIENYLNNL